MKSIYRYLSLCFSLFIVLGLFFFLDVQGVFAQSCNGGGVECGTSQTFSCLPAGCIFGVDNPCVCDIPTCTGGVTVGCGSAAAGGACQGDICGAAGRPCNIGGTCTMSSSCGPNEIFCGACNACMPNTLTCNQWEANSCGANGTGGGGGGGGGGGSCGGGSDCFPVSNCGEVGRQVQTGNCSGGICCAFAGGGGPQNCAISFSPNPANFAQGTTGTITAYVLGGTGTVSNVEFTNVNVPPYYLNWGPHDDGIFPYQTFIYPDSTQGTGTRIRAYATLSSGGSCANEVTVNVTACVPTCSGNQCGQSNGCGGTCPNTSSGIPPTPPSNLNPPNNGYGVPNASRQVTISWSSPSPLTDQYEIQIANASTPACGTPGSFCGVIGSATSYNFTITNGIYNYVYRVRAINTSCGSQPGPWTNLTYFSIVGTITGTFHLDPNQTAVVSGGTCVPGAGSSLSSPGSGADLNTIDISGANRVSAITGSDHLVWTNYWNPGNNVMTFTPGVDSNGDQYICTCPTGCQYSGISSPQTNVRFFFKQNNLTNQGWFQTRGGNAYAAQASSVALRSYVPTAYCTTGVGCIPYVLATDLAAKADSAGLALTGGGAVDTNKAAGNSAANTNERATQVTAIGTTNTKLRENYDFFYREFSLGTAPTDDFSTSAGDIRKPTTSPSGGKTAYYHNGDATLQNAWTVNSGEKITVFINGNLTISDPAGVGALVTVQPGGFLAFIVSGNITITPSVGNSVLTSITPNLSGVYIANGTITTQSVGTAGGGDKRFIGAGTFVGWTNVALQRDFDDGGVRKAENNTKPVETFNFRPDFVLNVPEEMTRSTYIWQETN